MGLTTTHGAWNGSYSFFHAWRKDIAECIGMDLDSMEGFFDKDEITIPTKWDKIEHHPLHDLLNHSDCDGFIEWEKCNAIADELEKIHPQLAEKNFSWDEATIKFIYGLRQAYEQQENLGFH